MKEINEIDVIIIGAGASGLLCASYASSGGKTVAVLDHNSSPGKKILISGGGKCNFSNRSVSNLDYHSENIHFTKSAFARYSSWDFIELVEENSIAYEERLFGQLFCQESSSDILNLLIREAEKNSVSFFYNSKIVSIQKNDHFIVETDDAIFQSTFLVVATGGLSYSEIGATGLGYDIAKQFEIKVEKTNPALVPLVLEEVPSLSGISLQVEITVNSKKIQDELLFTHKGLSGPAVLKATLFWNGGDLLSIDFLPEQNILEIIERHRKMKSKKGLIKIINEVLPLRLVTYLIEDAAAIDCSDIYQITKEDNEKINSAVHSWTVKPVGTEGYKKAEITKGGVSTDELSSKTMESRKVAGLYFIGEVVDVSGSLGGFNFQWCWSSGHIAGNHIASLE